MANMTLVEATEIVAGNSNSTVEAIESMDEGFVMSLAESYLEALATKPTKADRGPTMVDKVEQALKDLGQMVDTKALFAYMVDGGLATDGNGDTVNQYESMRSALTTGKNKAGKFINPEKGMWSVPTPEYTKRVKLAKLMELFDLERLEEVEAFLND